MALTLRLVKGTPLTNAELDGNFAYLRDEILARARYGSGLPAAALGVDGDFYVRTDEPFDGVLYKKAAGAWTTPKRNYTWAEVQATLLPASNYDGCVITVTDWGQDFASTGGNWIPVSKRLVLKQDFSQDADLVGDGTAQQHASDTIPGGLLVANCRIDMHGLFEFTGTTAGKVMRLGITGIEFVLLTASANNLSAHFNKSVYIVNPVNLTRWFANSQSNSDFAGSNSVLSESTAIDFSVDQDLQWRTTVTAPDTSALSARTVEIIFP